MDNNLKQINKEIFKKCALKISDFQLELESKEYDACRFKLNGRQIINRNAKVTPKKVGQFVTFWKRNGDGIIKPLEENDPIDFYAITMRTDKKFGQFVFPKSVLIKQGIISTNRKEGKRGFRVYPNWDVVKRKQAERTQKWQLDFFYEISDSTDFEKVARLYEIKKM